MEVEADEFDTAASVAALRKCAEAANAPPFPPDHRRLIRVVRPEPEPIIEVELGGMSAEEIAAKAKAGSAINRSADAGLGRTKPKACPRT